MTEYQSIRAEFFDEDEFEGHAEKRLKNSQHAYKDPRKFKTILCRHFEACGRCSYGDECSFAHGAHELRPMNNTFKTRLCVSWLAGDTCKYGDKCMFAHGAIELRKPSISEPCREYARNGRCEYGESCRYSHDISEDILKLPKQNKEISRPVTPPSSPVRPTLSSFDSPQLREAVQPTVSETPLFKYTSFGCSDQYSSLKDTEATWSPFSTRGFGPFWATNHVPQRMGVLQL